MSTFTAEIIEGLAVLAQYLSDTCAGADHTGHRASATAATERAERVTHQSCCFAFSAMINDGSRIESVSCFKLHFGDIPIQIRQSNSPATL